METSAKGFLTPERARYNQTPARTLRNPIDCRSDNHESDNACGQRPILLLRFSWQCFSRRLLINRIVFHEAPPGMQSRVNGFVPPIALACYQRTLQSIAPASPDIQFSGNAAHLVAVLVGGRPVGSGSKASGVLVPAARACELSFLSVSNTGKRKDTKEQ